jgi:hypothetical protein
MLDRVVVVFARPVKAVCLPSAYSGHIVRSTIDTCLRLVESGDRSVCKFNHFARYHHVYKSARAESMRHED